MSELIRGTSELGNTAQCRRRYGARSRRTGPRTFQFTTTCPGLLAQEDHAMLLRVGAQADPDEVHAARNPGATLVGAVPRRRVTARRHRALGQRLHQATRDVVHADVDRLVPTHDLVGVAHLARERIRHRTVEQRDALDRADLARRRRRDAVAEQAGRRLVDLQVAAIDLARGLEDDVAFADHQARADDDRVLVAIVAVTGAFAVVDDVGHHVAVLGAAAGAQAVLAGSDEVGTRVHRGRVARTGVHHRALDDVRVVAVPVEQDLATVAVHVLPLVAGRTTAFMGRARVAAERALLLAAVVAVLVQAATAGQAADAGLDARVDRGRDLVGIRRRRVAAEALDRDLVDALAGRALALRSVEFADRRVERKHRGAAGGDRADIPHDRSGRAFRRRRRRSRVRVVRVEHLVAQLVGDRDVLQRDVLRRVRHRDRVGHGRALVHRARGRDGLVDFDLRRVALDRAAARIRRARAAIGGGEARGVERHKRAVGAGGHVDDLLEAARLASRNVVERPRLTLDRQAEVGRARAAVRDRARERDRRAGAGPGRGAQQVDGRARRGVADDGLGVGVADLDDLALVEAGRLELADRGGAVDDLTLAGFGRTHAEGDRARGAGRQGERSHRHRAADVGNRAAAGVADALDELEARREGVGDVDRVQVDVAGVGDDQREHRRATRAKRRGLGRLDDLDARDRVAARLLAGDVLAQAVADGAREPEDVEHLREDQAVNAHFEVLAGGAGAGVGDERERIARRG